MLPGSPGVIMQRARALLRTFRFVLPALQVPELSFDSVEPPVSQPVGLLLCLVGLVLGLDEAIEPARQVQQVLGEEEGSECLGPRWLVPQDARQIFDCVYGGHLWIIS